MDKSVVAKSKRVRQEGVSEGTGFSLTIIPFFFKSQNIRVIADQSGEPWFVAKDICDALGLKNIAMALSKIPDHHKGVNSIDTLGGIQRLNFVDEPGLYRLILRCKKKEADPFIEWVTSKVIPQIRKTGRYQESAQERRRLRHEAASSYKVMSSVLQLIRQNNGKETKSFHYANEAKLINWVITGEYKPIDRESLPLNELNMMAKLEERNTVLIGCGFERDDRRKALEKFAADFKKPLVENNGQLKLTA